MKIRVLSANDLSREHWQQWDALQRSEPALASPFFRPEYTAEVAAVRDDVRVAVIEIGGETAGFLPYQQRHRAAWAVGGRLNDFQGPILPVNLDFSPMELIRGCGLAAWEFDHLLTDYAALKPHHRLVEPSTYVDLSGGFECYQARRKKLGGREPKQTLRKQRKFEEEVGTIRFEYHTTDRDVIRQLVMWKSEQYRQSGLVDIFSLDWTLPLLQRLIHSQGEHFEGILSALYAGDQLAAVHFGLRSGAVFHMWFLTYNRELSHYSPGLVLLVELLKAASARGVRRVDFAKGHSQMKDTFHTNVAQVAEGRVDSRPVASALWTPYLRMREAVRSSSLRVPAGYLYRKACVWMGY
jgi:CelD/BcsL family acetyltransferase involved in cellulose biosynthesis